MTNTILIYALFAASLLTTFETLLNAKPSSRVWALALVNQLLWSAFLIIAGPVWTLPLLIVSAALTVIYLWKTIKGER